MPATRTSVRVRGVTYTSSDEARVAADELEHRAQGLADDLRYDGKEAAAEQVVDRARADAERLRAFARELDAADAADTDQPPNRPASSRRPKRRQGGGSSRRVSGGGGGRASSKKGVGEAAVGGNLASLAGDLGRQAARTPVVGGAAVGAADLAWTVVGGIIGLSLVYALLNERGRGPAAVEQLAGSAGRGFHRFLDPHDTFLLGHKPQHAGSEKFPTVGDGAPGQTPSGPVTAAPRVTVPAGPPAPASGPNSWPGASGGSMPLLHKLVGVFGLSVTNVYAPGVDSAGGYHPKHRAIDVQPNARFQRFATWAKGGHASTFRELWGPGLGFYIKDGVVHAGDFPDYGTGPHGHIAI